MSYQEIGEALELPSGTVKSRISRAREKIRRSLDGNLFDFSSSGKEKGGMRS
jgi:DNA-directed RNA polymerase specialized sigma24 family protein